MRAPGLALALLAFVPGAAATALTFASPFQADGAAEWSGLESVVVVVPPGGSASWDLAMADGSSWRNVTQVAYHVSTAASYRDWSTVGNDTQRARGPVVAQLRNGGGWSAIVVTAESVSLALEGHHATEVVDPGASLYGRGPRPYPFGTHQFEATPGSAGIVTASTAAPGGTLVPFRLAAEGVRRVEWHNVTLECPSTDCRDGASSGAGGDGPVAVERWHFGSLEGTGALSGSGSAWAVLATGAHPSLAASGVVRLPVASCPDPCDLGAGTAFEGQTVTLTGRTRLSLEPRGEGFGSDVTGDWARASLDETVFWESPAGRSVGAVALLAALAGVAKAVGVLYARLIPREAEPEARRLLERLIAQEPGIQFRQLRRASGLPNGNAVHHLKRLESQGRIAARRHLGRVHYFVAGTHGLGQWQGVAALRDAQLKALHASLVGKPPRPQKEILAERLAQGCSRGSTQRGLERLVRAQLVDSWRQGRQRVYAARPDPFAPGARAAPLAGAS